MRPPPARGPLPDSGVAAASSVAGADPPAGAGAVTRAGRRLDEIDSLMARSQVAIGVSAIHTLWLFDRPVDLDRIHAFEAALRRGVLGRVIAPATLGAAGDRWTTAANFAPIAMSATLARSELEHWITARSHDDLDVYGGPAWRLSLAPLDDGATAVSLLTSHAIADASFLRRALTDAIAGRDFDFSDLDRKGAMPPLLEEALRALTQLGRVARLQATRLRRDHDSSDPAGSHSAEPLSAKPIQLPPDFRIPRTTAVIPRHDWTAAAHTRGATSTVLALAVLADLAAVLGRTTTTGTVRLRVPVSLRTGENDLRANAITGITLDVAPDPGRARDLRPLRAQLKQSLTVLAGRNPANETLAIATNMITPRPEFARMVARYKHTDYLSAACGIFGEFDPAIARLDGGTPATMAMGLINRPLETPPRLGETGGSLTSA